MLELKKDKLTKELKKYEKFSLFLNKSQKLFNQSSIDYQDIQQMMNRYESLTLMINDTRERLEHVVDTLSKSRIEFSNVIQCESDQYVRDYDLRQELKSKLNDMETKNGILGENFNRRIDIINGKTVQFDLISKSINNIYDLLHKKLNFNLMNKSPIKKGLNQISDVKHKLKFIKDKLSDLNDISLI